MVLQVTSVEVKRAFAYNETGRLVEIGAGEFIEGVMLVVLLGSLEKKLNVVIDGGASGGDIAGQVDRRQVLIGQEIDVAGDNLEFADLLHVLGLDAS